jgi:two-component system CheB/CheR fusion protein
VAELDLDHEFDELLAMMKETRGSDFTGYKRTTLQRRVKRRMILLDLATFAEYKDYLELQPEEFGQLFDSLLINVTGFFRDPLAWQALREQVLPELFSAKGVKTPIRVWSAGCATGEEAYTLAIVLAEALGHDQFRERVKIYATDLDEDALQQARAGAYDTSALTDVPEKLRDTYFEPAGEKHVFRRDLRRQVIFGRNDLTHDAPISPGGPPGCAQHAHVFQRRGTSQRDQEVPFRVVSSGLPVPRQSRDAAQPHGRFSARGPA